MVYSHEKKYIFLRNPKTGSRSMQRILRKHGSGINGRGPHLQPHKIIRQLGEDCWNDYFKFVFVRNPWDHFVSIWFWYKHRGDIPENESLRTLALKGTVPGYYFDPFLFHNGELCIDYIGKMETLQQDWEIIANRLSLPAVRMLNVSSNYFRHRDYTLYYGDDTETIEKVRELYRPEIIEYLGYKYGR
jgi:hypothetical protein